MMLVTAAMRSVLLMISWIAIGDAKNTFCNQKIQRSITDHNCAANITMDVLKISINCFPDDDQPLLVQITFTRKIKLIFTLEYVCTVDKLNYKQGIVGNIQRSDLNELKNYNFTMEPNMSCIFTACAHHDSDNCWYLNTDIGYCSNSNEGEHSLHSSHSTASSIVTSPISAMLPSCTDIACASNSMHSVSLSSYLQSREVLVTSSLNVIIMNNFPTLTNLTPSSGSSSSVDSNMMTLIASVVGMCLIITVGILLLFSFMLVYKKFTQAYHQRSGLTGKNANDVNHLPVYHLDTLSVTHSILTIEESLQISPPTHGITTTSANVSIEMATHSINTTHLDSNDDRDSIQSFYAPINAK